MSMTSSERSNEVVSEELLEAISNKKIIVDYMSGGPLPSIDSLLDRRLAAMRLFDIGIMNHNCYIAEILSVDFLLWKHK